MISESIAPNFVMRLARESDIAGIGKLIPLSVRRLQAAYYSGAQMEAALGSVFDVDRQLIRDGTYFVAEHLPSVAPATSRATGENQIIGCGGWGKRKTLFGGHHQTSRDDAELDPARDSARIRAFYVHPAWARRRIGRAILKECEKAIRAAKFKSIELAATLPGVPFYAACGYVSGERLDIPLPSDLSLQIVRMTKELG